MNDLPASLEGIKATDVHRFLFEEQFPLPSRKNNGAAERPPLPVDVLAVILPEDDSGGERITVRDMPVALLRKLGTKLGVHRCSRIDKWAVIVGMTKIVKDVIEMRRADAAAQGGTGGGVPNAMVDPIGQPSPSNEARKDRNAVVRFTNVIFSPEYSGTCLSLSDRRNRATIERGIGAHGEFFWHEVAKEFDVVEDPDDDPYSGLNYDLAAGDTAIVERFDSADVDASDFTLLVEDASKLKGWWKQLLSVHRAVESAMSKSGTHDPDVFNYVEWAAKKVKCTKLGIFPIYYFLLHVENCPDFQAKFGQYMSNRLSGTSARPPEPDENDGKSKRRASVDDSSLAAAVNRLAGADKRQCQNLERESKLRQEAMLVEMWEKNKAILASLETGTEIYEKFKARDARLQLEIFGTHGVEDVDPPAASVCATGGDFDSDSDSDSDSD